MTERVKTNKNPAVAIQDKRCFGLSNKREISEGWKCDGGALGKSQPRALGARKQRRQRAHVGDSRERDLCSQLSLTTCLILGKSLGLSFPNCKVRVFD